MVPARLDVPIAVGHPLDQRRSDLLAATIAEDVLTFPPLVHYPALEDAAAELLRAALLGRLPVTEALALAQQRALIISDRP
jgi:hypothetical protein